MTSYFVAYHAPSHGEVAVHDRTSCPPDCFLRDSITEYLGDFLDSEQAVAVARLRYAHARICPCGEPAPMPHLPLSTLLATAPQSPG